MQMVSTFYTNEVLGVIMVGVGSREVSYAVLEKLFTGSVLHLTPISLKFHRRREISQTIVI